VVGGGIAGVLLAWRLLAASPVSPVSTNSTPAGVEHARNPVPSSSRTSRGPAAGFGAGAGFGPAAGVGGGPRLTVDVFTGGRRADADATAASGGLVRGFETSPAACLAAAESLAELRGSATLRAWAGYREVGAVYLLPPGADPAGSVRVLDAVLPGSATVLSAARLAARYPFRGLPAGTTGVVERHAGYLSPARLRSAVLTELVAGGCTVHRRPVTSVTPAPAVRLADGSVLGYDIVVVAAGAWTPRLLADSGLACGGLRTKHIQYSVHAVRLSGLGAFVEDSTGFYGRPADDFSFLLGLPSPRWDVDPSAPSAAVPDQVLAEQVVAYAGRRLGVSETPHAAPRTVASFDCYHEPPGLALRDGGAPGSALFTFTGGSGGAAKSVLAASRAAAGVLVGLHAGCDAGLGAGLGVGPRAGRDAGPGAGRAVPVGERSVPRRGTEPVIR